MSGIKKCFGTTRYNVSEKRIKANITLHFELGGCLKPGGL